jgi:hypothetical protein
MAFPITGGNLPAQQVPAANNATGYRAANSLQSLFQPTANPFAGRDYNQLVDSSLEHFMDPNSQYIQNARQAGMNMANTRGGINSSIAAGASEKSALDAAVPLAQGAVASQLGQEQATLSNWLDTQGFNREMNAKPYENSLNMLNSVTAASLKDPQLYTPSVISGYTNFFNQQMNDTIEKYFSNGG